MLVVAAIAAAALLVYVLMLQAAEAHAFAPPPPPPAIESPPRPPARVYLLRSQASAAWFAGLPGAQPGAYDASVAWWETRLRAAGHTVTRIDDAALAAGVAADASRLPRPVLVVPSAAALADVALAGLLHTVAQGAGVVASWQLAGRKADGSWRGWGALATLVGAEPIAPADLPEAPALRWVTLLGGAAVTSGLPSGARIEMQPFDPPLPLASPAAAADFTRWELLPFGPYERPIRPTAVAEARYQRGRAVWLNFEPKALVPAGNGPGWLDGLLANAIAWAAGLPLAEVEPWPGGARIAAMTGLDTEQDFAQGTAVAERFAAAGVPLTAFAVSRLAQADPDVVRRLALAGEVGSHTDDHKPLAGRDLADQQDQLARSRDILSALSGQPVVGLRPPEERVDAATFEALVATGYEYVAGPADKDRAVPDLRAVGDQALAVLPRIPLDDYEFTVRVPASDPAVVATAVARDLAQLRRLGGLFLWDFHTQFVDDAVLAPGIDAVLALGRAPDVWRATGRDVAAWWRARASAAAGVSVPASGSADVVVTLAAAAPIERLAVRVHLPAGAGPPVLAGAGAGVSLVRLDDDTVRLDVAALRSGERRQVVVRPAAR